MSKPPSVFGGFSMALEQVIYNKVSTQSILVFMPMVKKDMNKGGRTKAVEVDIHHKCCFKVCKTTTL